MKGSTGFARGTARPFPLWRLRSGPVRRPSIQNIRERYSDHVPPGPNTWTLNIQPLGQFLPHRSFLLARSTLPSSVARLLHNAGYRLLRRFEDA
jgi:hypothetical protein